jgi:DNA-binding NtrC family response regulator
MPYEGRDVSVASVRDLSWRKALEDEVQRSLSEQDLEFIGNLQAKSATQDDLFRPGGELAHLALPEALEAFEKRAIAATLAHHQGNTNKAAEILGISVRTLQRKIKKYRL